MVVQVVREILEESEKRASRLTDEAAEPVEGRDFAGALRGDGVSVIAEVKPSSPTRDFSDFDPVEAARAMERGGASALSVLTEPTRFGGSMENLESVREAVDLPVLRKDFVVDERQLHETARVGADAVLLIARFLDDLDRFVEASTELELEPLVEVHDAEELERGLATDAEVVGVNSRDLETLEVDLSVAEELVPRVDRISVAESGIRSRDDMVSVKDAGADAALIGTAIVEGDVEERSRTFVEAGE